MCVISADIYDINRQVPTLPTTMCAAVYAVQHGEHALLTHLLKTPGVRGVRGAEDITISAAARATVAEVESMVKAFPEEAGPFAAALNRRSARAAGVPEGSSYVVWSEPRGGGAPKPVAKFLARALTLPQAGMELVWRAHSRASTGWCQGCQADVVVDMQRMRALLRDPVMMTNMKVSSVGSPKPCLPLFCCAAAALSLSPHFSTTPSSPLLQVVEGFEVERIGPRLDKSGKAQVGCAPTVTYTNKQGKRTRDWNVGMPLDRFKWTWKMQQELLTLPAVQQLLLKQELLYQEHVKIFMEARSFPPDVSSSLLDRWHGRPPRRAGAGCGDADEDEALHLHICCLLLHEGQEGERSEHAFQGAAGGRRRQRQHHRHQHHGRAMLRPTFCGHTRPCTRRRS